MKPFLGTWVLHPIKSGAYVGAFDNGVFKSAPILGFVDDVTVAKLKLAGAISCLEQLGQPSEITLVTEVGDDYIYHCVNEWAACWSQNGWKTKAGNVITNQAEVERLSQLLKTHSVTAAQAQPQEEQAFHDGLVITARNYAFQCERERRRVYCPRSPR